MDKLIDRVTKHCGYRAIVTHLLQAAKLPAGDPLPPVLTQFRKLPLPLKGIIGDLSNAERVLVGLDLRLRKEAL